MNEQYGRSPAMECLPDIKEFNEHLQAVRVYVMSRFVEEQMECQQ